MNTNRIGNIYKIICYSDPNFTYIGSTEKSLERRWQWHQSYYKHWCKDDTDITALSYKHFDKYGIDKFKIVLIKQYQIVDEVHLKAYEQLWINKFKCCNESMPFRIDYLYYKQYYIDNRQKKLDYQNKYSIDNKVKIKERMSKKVNCDCGITVTYSNLKRHKQSIQHINWESSKI